MSDSGERLQALTNHSHEDNHLVKVAHSPCNRARLGLVKQLEMDSVRYREVLGLDTGRC